MTYQVNLAQRNKKLFNLAIAYYVVQAVQTQREAENGESHECVRVPVDNILDKMRTERQGCRRLATGDVEIESAQRSVPQQRFHI